MRTLLLSAIAMLGLSVPAQAETFQDCATCPPLVTVPAGPGIMGSNTRSDAEKPLTTLEITTPFAMTETEITVGQFREFADAIGYPKDGPCFVFDGRNWDSRSGFSWADPGYPQEENFPATCLNLEDAEAYTRWLSRETGQAYRLPNEAEWEYAARAGNIDPVFIAVEDICSLGNSAGGESGFDYRNEGCRDEHAFAAPVRSHPANAFGLYGMLGNMLEWTQDCFAPSHADAREDGGPNPEGDCRYRVMKGGNWAAAAQHLHPSDRGVNTPGARWSTNGLRLVRELD